MITFSAPFPPISWWLLAMKDRDVYIDHAEHYQKMSYRNRYYLAAPEGKLLLSIPLEKGRNQRLPMTEVAIDNRTDWQTRHWRSIVSLYNRSPFFQYFEHHIAPLYTQSYDLLTDFNTASIQLIDRLLELELNIIFLNEYKAHYPDTEDLRTSLLPNQPEGLHPHYYQVFADRSGFLPDCSILDLLFCEALQAKLVLLPK